MTLLPDTRQQLMLAAERQASSRLSRPRIGLGWVAPAVSLAIVLALAAVFLSIHGSRTTPRLNTAAHRIEITFRAEPAPGLPVVTRSALDRTVQLLHARIGGLTVSPASIAILPGNLIRVRMSSRLPGSVVARDLEVAGQLEFYDWEADLLLPSGHTVASRLTSGDPLALRLSQGSGSAPPGASSDAAGGLDLYQAVLVASGQPYSPRPGNARAGSEYYLFSAPGTQLCAAVARAEGRPLSNVRCLLSGPLDVSPGTPRATALRQLYLGAPAAERRRAQALEIKQGTIVLQGAARSFSAGRTFYDPDARYYVLRDRGALFGSEITNPVARADLSKPPDVQFGFTSRGARAFQRLTSSAAARGQRASTLGQTLDQHIAVALDNQLITVPSIDFSVYPDGITGRFGADLTGGFTVRSSRRLARELRLGPLPVRLVPVG